MADKPNSKKITVKQSKKDDEKPEILIGDYKDKIEKTKANFKDISNQVKSDIKKKPYQSIAIALGTGILIGSALTSIKKSRETNIPINQYKNRFFKTKDSLTDFSSKIKDEIQENPGKSLTIALGLGALATALSKAKRGKEE